MYIFWNVLKQDEEIGTCIIGLLHRLIGKYMYRYVINLIGHTCTDINIVKGNAASRMPTVVEVLLWRLHLPVLSAAHSGQVGPVWWDCRGLWGTVGRAAGRTWCGGVVGEMGLRDRRRLANNCLSGTLSSFGTWLDKSGHYLPCPVLNHSLPALIHCPS